MSEQDMKQKWIDSEEYSDLCTYCLSIAEDPDNIDIEPDWEEYFDEQIYHES